MNKQINEQVVEITIKKAIKDHKSKLIYLDIEDVYSELWCVALQLHNRLEYLNSSLLLKAFHNKIVDLIRMYNNKIYKDIPIQEYNSREDDRWSGYSKLPKYYEKFSDSYEIKEILNLFPDNSKEKSYVLIWINKLGMDIDMSTNSNCYNKVTENEIAKELGYANGCSNGYRRIRNNVREALKIYLESI